MKRRKYPRHGVVRTRFGLAKLMPKNGTAARHRKTPADPDAPLWLEEPDATAAPEPAPAAIAAPPQPRHLRDFFRIMATFATRTT